MQGVNRLSLGRGRVVKKNHRSEAHNKAVHEVRGLLPARAELVFRLYDDLALAVDPPADAKKLLLQLAPIGGVTIEVYAGSAEPFSEIPVKLCTAVDELLLIHRLGRIYADCGDHLV